MLKKYVIITILFYARGAFSLPDCWPNMEGEVRYEDGQLYTCVDREWVEVPFSPVEEKDDDPRTKLYDSEDNHIGYVLGKIVDMNRE